MAGNSRQPITKTPGNPNNLRIRGFAISIYESMVSTAVVEDSIVKWFGSVSELFRVIGINQGYHTPVIRLLTTTNCIEQVVRGSRGVPSEYVIHRDPRMIPESDWPSVSAIVKSPKDHLTTSAAEYKLLVQQVKGIEERLAGLDIVTALVELQQGLDELTKRITVIESKLGVKQHGS